MEPRQIESLCLKRAQELLDEHFGTIATEAAVERPETIGRYTKDLPLRIEAEYRTYLEGLWAEHAPEAYRGQPLVLEEQALRSLLTERLREEVDAAFRDATEQTLWERITKSNHRDVTYYKGLLRDYTQELLAVMRQDFMEEISGEHIHGKAFDDYTPQPLDTADVTLPDELMPLAEQMSKNVHEVWAQMRIAEGWTYGPQRDDQLKTHPCLVPYEALPESEKAYDRNTAIGTLRMILKLGFKISKGTQG